MVIADFLFGGIFFLFALPLLGWPIVPGEPPPDLSKRGSGKRSPLPAPSVGDEIYVPSALYVSHGEDDILGGCAIVESIKKEKHGNEIVHGVTVQELPSRTYYWENGLAEEQEGLRERFGSQRARPDPDEREEFNSGSFITQDVIRRWLREAKEKGATHVIVVSDAYDHTYCPLSVMPGEDPREKATGAGLVKEVYSLSRDIESQLAENRAFHFD